MHVRRHWVDSSDPIVIRMYGDSGLRCYSLAYLYGIASRALVVGVIASHWLGMKWEASHRTPQRVLSWADEWATYASIRGRIL